MALKLVVNLGYTRDLSSSVEKRMIFDKQKPYVSFRIGNYAYFVDNSRRAWRRKLWER